jgi:hypothetical protein
MATYRKSQATQCAPLHNFVADSCGVKIWNLIPDGGSPINRRKVAIHHFPPLTLELMEPAIQRFRINPFVAIALAPSYSY